MLLSNLLIGKTTTLVTKIGILNLITLNLKSLFYLFISIEVHVYIFNIEFLFK